MNEESKLQAEEEEQMGLPLSFDINSMTDSKFCQSQIGFIKFLVKPLYFLFLYFRLDNMCGFLGLNELTTQLDVSLDYWVKRSQSNQEL